MNDTAANTCKEKTAGKKRPTYHGRHEVNSIEKTGSVRILAGFTRGNKMGKHFGVSIKKGGQSPPD